MLRRQCVFENFREELAKLLLDTVPVPVARGDDGGQFAIGNFDILELAEVFDIPPRTYVVDAGVEEIERIAWASVMRALVMSLDRDVGYAVFADAINNELPTDWIRRLFGGKRLSATILARICRLSPRAVKSEREALLRHDPAKAAPILSLLQRGRR